MGFLSKGQSKVDKISTPGFLQKDTDAPVRAAEIAAAANRAGTEEIRRQFNVTQANIAPFIEAGTGALPGLIEGATASGLDARLAEIFNTDIFGALVDERQRGLQGQLAAGGLTRSGTALQEAANIPTSLGLQIEGLLSGRLSNLAGSGQNAAVGLGALGSTASQGIAGLTSQAGQNIASGILGQQQAQAQQQQNTLQVAATAAAIFFSDENLKTNVEKIATIHDLNLYEWDWIDSAGDMVKACGTIGFIAQEVKEKYPEFVAEWGGFKVIDYPNLLDELNAHLS